MAWGLPVCHKNLFAFKIGKKFFSDGTRYEGEFNDGMFCGRGNWSSNKVALYPKDVIKILISL